MKSVFRVPIALVSLVLLLWGGIALSAETSTVPESPEYLMKVVRDAPWPLHTSLQEVEGEPYLPAESMVAEVKLPEIGSYEYSTAMETGSLPSTCGDEPCPSEMFTIIESGGILYRLEVDCGGN